MLGWFGGHKYQLVPTGTSPKRNKDKHAVFTQVLFVLLGCALVYVIWRVWSGEQIKRGTHGGLDAKRLQTALSIAEESSRILLDKHTQEMKATLDEMDQKDNLIKNLQTQVQQANQKIKSLSCRAGLTEPKLASDESKKAKQYTLTSSSSPSFTFLASSESEPGINHILGQYRSDQYHLQSLSLEGGDIVLDVGAHVGCFSISVARKFPDVRVVALEPLPANLYFLKQNKESLKLTNLEIIPKGVSSHGRPMWFWLNSGNTGGSSAFEEHPNEDFCVETVKLTDLLQEYSSLLPNKKNKLVLNMDCEGCEFDALVAAEKVLDKVTYLQVETHEHMQSRLPESLQQKMTKTSEIAREHRPWY